MYHGWKQGMKEWKRLYEIDQLKHLIMGKREMYHHSFIESKSEILDEVVQAYVQKMSSSSKSKGGAGKPEHADKEESESDDNGEEYSNENDDIYYFHKQEKKYKVFDPVNKTWSAQIQKPTLEQIKTLRDQQDVAKKEEQRLFDVIRHEIAGEPDSDQEAAQNGSRLRRDSNAAHDKIASDAAKEVLQRMHSHEDSKTTALEESEAKPETAEGEDSKPMTAEEIVSFRNLCESV